MPQSITKETLVPISIVCAIGYGAFNLSEANSKIETNVIRIDKTETAIEDHEAKDSKEFIEIIQRLTRIEEAVKDGERNR